MFRKSLIGLAAIASLGLVGAVSAAPIVFNTHDTAGVITVNNFVWQAGNALVLSGLSTAVGSNTDVNGNVIAGSQLLHTVAQARLGSFTLQGGGSASLTGFNEVTYQADFWEIAVGIGGPSAAFVLAAPPAGFTNSVKFYYDTGGVAGVNFGNDKTGLGYGADPTATLILNGTLKSLVGNISDLTQVSPAVFPVTSLDCDAAGSGCVGFDGIDQGVGTKTHVELGNNQLQVDITNPTPNGYFLSNVSSLLIDMSQTVGVGVPFNNGNPWRNVVGNTPSFSFDGTTRINGGDCTGGGTHAPTGQTQGGVNTSHCDILLQTTGLTTFNAVPEPTSLALVGLVLTGMGVVARRRKVHAV